MTQLLGDELAQSVAAIRAALPAGAAPRVGLVLGSGLGAFANDLTGATGVAYAELPGFPSSTVTGHAGKLVYGRHEQLEVLCMQGRVHFYEGHDMARVAFPVRALVGAGCDTVILTNAAGAVDPSLKPGQLAVLRDHLNLLPQSPLRGPNDDRVGPRFPDMSAVYDPGLQKVALAVGAELGLTLGHGVYAALPGPAYETPAEVRMLRVLGADLVGMSTVPEAMVAVHMGARVLGLSLVTNLAAGVGTEKLSHAEVTATADATRADFARLLSGILSRLAREHEESK